MRATWRRVSSTRGEITVIGFDDRIWTDTLTPKPTTVGQRARDIRRIATKILTKAKSMANRWETN
jgi:DNA-binding LacI/PurR family transcriptional regulator